MKQFLYLDNDIVNSIIAQADQGFISEFSKETESGQEHTKNKEVNWNASGEAGGSIWKLANAAIKMDFQGTLGSEKSVHSSSRELITKTLHDAAFDMAYAKISPIKVEIGTTESDDYREYIEIKRVFDVVDFEYLENIFSKGGLIELIKKSEKTGVAKLTLNTSLTRYKYLQEYLPVDIETFLNYTYMCDAA